MKVKPIEVACLLLIMAVGVLIFILVLNKNLIQKQSELISEQEEWLDKGYLRLDQCNSECDKWQGMYFNAETQRLLDSISGFKEAKND